MNFSNANSPRLLRAGILSVFLALPPWLCGNTPEETAPANSPTPAPAQVEIPVVEGEDTLGIRVPYHDESGRLVMELEAEIARKSTEKEIEMEQVNIEFFDEDGEKFWVKLPRCTFDMDQRILSGNDSATISRNDFQIAGQSIHFEMDNQRGRLGGPVTMTLYNIDPTKE